MSPRNVAIVVGSIAVILAGANVASATGAVYNPLLPHIHYYLKADGNESNTMGSNTTTTPVPLFSVPTTASPSTTTSAPYKNWSVAATHAYNLSYPVTLHLFVEAMTAPVVGPPTGPMFTAWLVYNGVRVENATNPGPTPAIVQPGTPYEANFTFVAPNISVKVHDVLGLSVQFNWAAPTAANGNLVYAFGNKDTSDWTAQAVESTIAAAGVVHGSGVTYGAGAIPSFGTLPVNVIGVGVVETPAATYESFAPVYANITYGQAIDFEMSSLDTPAVGMQHEDGAGGLVNPYVVVVSNGVTTFQENLYPGEWVLWKVTPSASGTWTIHCSSCNDNAAMGDVFVKAASGGTQPGTNPGGGTQTGNNSTTTKTPTSVPPATNGGLFGLPAPSAAWVIAGVGATALAISISGRRARGGR